MFTVIGCMIAGIFIGYAARRIRFSWISLPTLGLDALLLTLAALLGSSLAAWGLWKVVCVTYKGKDTIQKDREFACKGGNIACEEKNITNEKGGTAYKKGGATSEEISAASEGESTIRKEEKEEKR